VPVRTQTSGDESEEIVKKIGVVAVMVLLAGSVVAQAPAKYAPSEVQLLKLQVRQKDAQLAQVAAQQAYTALLSEAAAVKRENKWDDKVIFNPESLTFTDPPAPRTEAPKP
jgi:hypothetical protein